MLMSLIWLRERLRLPERISLALERDPRIFARSFCVSPDKSYEHDLLTIVDLDNQSVTITGLVRKTGTSEFIFYWLDINKRLQR